jgi:uncharacterized protein (TIGR02611 family)
MLKEFRGLSFDTAQVKQASAPAIPEPSPSPPIESVEMPKSFREMMHRRYKSKTAMQRIKRIVVTVVGGTVLALGIALIVLPGPAFIVMPGGLAILAIEFAWARRWLRSARAILPLRSQAILHRIGVRRREPSAEQNNGGKPRIEADSF